ncbi:MAG: NAD(P)/FAD-dependent oxidoreductase, partial [Gammaproteobacteria bacterium]
YATGFDAHRFIRGVQISGLNGVTVDEAWKDGLYAHRSMSLPGFPNLFMMIGPNSPIGNFSLIMVAEEQIRYILALVEEIRQGRCTRLQPREEACAAFNAAVRGA